MVFFFRKFYGFDPKDIPTQILPGIPFENSSEYSFMYLNRNSSKVTAKNTLSIFFSQIFSKIHPRKIVCSTSLKKLPKDFSMHIYRDLTIFFSSPDISSVISSAIRSQISAGIHLENGPEDYFYEFIF